MKNKKHFDWIKFIEFNLLILRIVGLWPKHNKSYKFELYSVYSIFVLTIFLFLNIICETINLYFIRNNLEAVTGTIFILLTKIATCLKVSITIKNLTVLKNLFSILNCSLFQPKNSYQKLLVQTNLNFWRMLFNGILYSTCISIIFASVFPLLDKEEFRLPALAWYPFDYQFNPVYSIIYVYQIMSMLTCALANINLDALVSALNICTAAQFDILCENLTTFDDSENGMQRNYRHHKKILRYNKNV